MPRNVRIRIHLDLCRACPPCQAIKSCKTRAIQHPDAGEPPYLEFDRCHDCGVCIQACPFEAIAFLGAVRSGGKQYPVFVESL